MRVAVQAESDTVPAWPLAEVAEALENRTVPKSVRASTLVPPGVTAEGASATHSADEMSGEAMVRVLVNDLPVVSFVSRSVTDVPLTFTDAEMRSPAETASGTLTEAAGTSSYQAEYRTVPSAEQSASVPVCSSPLVDVESPPSPTQKADAVVPDVSAEHVAEG